MIWAWLSVWAAVCLSFLVAIAWLNYRVKVADETSQDIELATRELASGVFQYGYWIEGAWFSIGMPYSITSERNGNNA